MIVCYAFIGPLPNYIQDTVFQTRLFFDGDIYLIADDLQSPYIPWIVKKYGVIVVPYRDVESREFREVEETHRRKFTLVRGLKGREKLFIYSFERFFLLQNLMRARDIQDVLFLELDNLIYDDPRKWLPAFSTHDLAYMCDNVDRFASGIMYVKSAASLQGLLHTMLHYIATSREFLNEMSALAIYYKQQQQSGGSVQVLPTFYADPTGRLPRDMIAHFEKYNETIFDSSALGIYLLGKDPFHTGGVIQKYLRWDHNPLDYTKEKVAWHVHDDGKRKPFVWNPIRETWVLVNNLHVHSKNTREALSCDEIRP